MEEDYHVTKNTKIIIYYFEQLLYQDKNNYLTTKNEKMTNIDIIIKNKNIVKIAKIIKIKKEYQTVEFINDKLLKNQHKF